MTSVGCLILLPPGLGWDIMGYESEPLPSYTDLRNYSCSVKLITTLPCLLLRIIYRVFIPQAHHPDCPRHHLRLRAHWIDRPAGHPLRLGCLPSLDIYSDGLYPRGVHHLLYRWIPPLSACLTFRRHPCDPLRHPMVERCQDLEHLPGHHPAM